MRNGHQFTEWRVESLYAPKFNTPRGPIHKVLSTINGYPSTVCTIEEYSEVPDFDTDRLGDAQFISACPDLYDAVIDLLNCMGISEVLGNHSVQVQKAIAALKKATGEMPESLVQSKCKHEHKEVINYRDGSSETICRDCKRRWTTAADKGQTP